MISPVCTQFQDGPKRPFYVRACVHKTCGSGGDFGVSWIVLNGGLFFNYLREKIVVYGFGLSRLVSEANIGMRNDGERADDAHFSFDKRGAALQG